jgi:hypothetical protein
MEKQREKIGRTGDHDDANSRTTLPGEWTKSLFSELDKQKPLAKDRNSSEILAIYLRSLGYCARKRRRHCISQTFGR